MIPLVLLTQLLQPVPKLGSCPLGYYSQGAYCVPSTGPEAIIRTGSSCPAGWYKQGRYCVLP